MVALDTRMPCVFSYNTALFEADTVRRFADQFLRLVSELCAEPGIEIGRLAMIDDAARAQRNLFEYSGCRQAREHDARAIRHFAYGRRLRKEISSARKKRSRRSISASRVEKRFSQERWGWRRACTLSITRKVCSSTV